MINYLQTDSKSIKYVDDTTMYHISSDPADSTLQLATDSAIAWSDHPHLSHPSYACPGMTVSGWMEFLP